MKFVWLALVSFLAITAGYTVFRGCSSPKTLTAKDVEIFNRWRQAFGKLYASPSESDYRMNVLVGNHYLVEKMNAEYNAALLANNRPPLRGPMFGLMPWSDMPIDEFQSRYTGANLKEDAVQLSTESELESPVPTPKPSLGQVPYQIRIRNQGGCGSCWAFSTIATIEKQFYETYRVQLDFSQQQLVDCDMSNGGCAGGWMTNAINYIRTAGLARESSYLYNGMKNTACLIRLEEQISIPNIAPTQIGFTVAKAMNGAARGLSMGTGVHVNSNFYQIRAVNDPYDITLLARDQCFYQINHAVNIIAAGYDNINGVMKPYVQLQNSWGPYWGNNGLVKVYTCSETALWGSGNIIIHGTGGLFL